MEEKLQAKKVNQTLPVSFKSMRSMRVSAEPRILKRPQNVNQCALFIKREIPTAWMFILCWVCAKCVFLWTKKN